MNSKSYPYRVILQEAYAGEIDWGCQTRHHALALAKDLRARGCVVTRIHKLEG